MVMKQIKVKDFDIYVGDDGRIFVDKNGTPYSNETGNELVKALIGEIYNLEKIIRHSAVKNEKEEYESI